MRKYKEKPISPQQIKAIRQIAKQHGILTEDLCFKITGGITQIVDELTYKQAANFLYHYEKAISIGPDNQ